MRKIILLIFITCITQISQGQNKVLESFDLINKFKIEEVEKYLNENFEKESRIKELLFLQIQFIKKGKLSLDKYEWLAKLKIENEQEDILRKINIGDYFLFSYLNEDIKAIENYVSALNKAIEIENKVLICETLKKLIYFNYKFSRNLDNFKIYLDEYKKYKYSQNEELYYKYFELLYKTQLKGSGEKVIIPDDDYHKLIQLSESKDNPVLKAHTYHLLGLKTGPVDGKLKKSKQYYNESFKIYESYKSYAYFEYRVFNYYLSLGGVNYLLKDYDESLKYLQRAESTPLTNYKKRDIEGLYNFLYLVFKSLNDYEKAFLYSMKEREIKENINKVESDIKIIDIDTKYETQKKEAQIYNLILAILLIVLIGGSISFLLVNNSNKKRLLALQEKELILKEQEITSINAMVEGQEKERKRVAEDLHDNLGSVLATLKLHFENLKINREKKKINQETLFDKTEGLIDEAYLKVRSIAHAKNAGVIANQGLLVAIQMMAEKISSANAVQIEVVHFGLDKPIENSLEISLFRIIQELITNIIKHAEASQATIHISQYENNINIILEDNGKGMDVSQMNTQKGMGLHSIKTRITHLQGTFTIDSTPTKGTSILIDVPI